MKQQYNTLHQKLLEIRNKMILLIAKIQLKNGRADELMEEYEILQREQKLQNTVDWKDKHGGNSSVVDAYTKYLQEREGSRAPKGVIDHNTADLPIIESPEGIHPIEEESNTEPTEATDKGE